jgi:hypothetical protein
MSNTNNGGPAFPAFEHHAGYGQMMAVGGMTLRDYFAIRAFQTRLAKYNDWTLTELTEQSYADADAMLKAREAK